MPEYDVDRARPYEIRRTGIKPPSSNWSDIACPFCGRVVRAYWWSLAGSGKKCPCGALHGSFGTVPLKGVNYLDEAPPVGPPEYAKYLHK